MSGQLVLVLRVFLALALYAFLCLILWMIWEDLKRAGFRAIRPKVPPIRLEVQTQHADPIFRAFAQNEVTVGRDPVCEIPIDDESMSARHAKFSFHHRQWWVEDLHSTNGTALNEMKLTTATVLTNGDEVRCGKARLLVYLSVDTLASQVGASEE
jgi:pSer/pThr/pTyr-binding forkhead associated (FHA) protein